MANITRVREDEILKAQNRQIWLTLAGFFVLVPVLIPINRVALTGDPAFYLDRVTPLLEGQIPYLDYPFEHFPVSLVPMVAAWTLGGFQSTAAYTVAFAALMAGCLIGTAFLADRAGRLLGLERAGLASVLITGPLFPLVLFRSDPWPTLLAMGAMLTLLAGTKRTVSPLQVTAAWAKGWPVVFAPLDWAMGRRMRATILLTTTIGLMLLLAAAPGFREPRIFTGIHTDTLIGAALSGLRALGGDPVGRFDAAGAIYLEAPSWAVVVNLNLGLLLGGLAVSRINSPVSLQAVARAFFALVVAVLIASPLLSPQFIVWCAPFAALYGKRTIAHLTFWVSALTMIFMLGWNPVYEGHLWWLAVLNMRNLALVVLAVLAAWWVGEESQPPLTSRHQPVAVS